MSDGSSGGDEAGHGGGNYPLYDASCVTGGAERDENAQRQGFAPSEAVDLGRVIEAVEREISRDSQGIRTDLQPSGNFPEGRKPRGRETRDVVGEAVGMSGRTYEKARAVVEAAEDESLSELVAVYERNVGETGVVSPPSGAAPIR